MRIDEYIDPMGRIPYREWVISLKDLRAKTKITLQVAKMTLGLFGDSQAVGKGLSELRIHIGHGYRIYYAKVSLSKYLLLCGGEKSTQSKDIKLAKRYWNEYQKRGHPYEA